VDAFLGLIAQDYDSVTNELEMLNQKLATMDESIAHYSKMENALETTLLLAQDAAVQLKDKANSESERIIREANEAVVIAQDEAKHIVESAKVESERIISEAREAAESAHTEAERIILEAREAVQGARTEVQMMLDGARSESVEIVRSAEESAKGIIDKSKRDVTFVIDEFDATMNEYMNFRSKFKDFMVLQMDTFNEMDEAFKKHYEELRARPAEQAGEGTLTSGTKAEAEGFEDNFFEKEETTGISHP
ncbi:MAG TPA: DivIVA domain-containing protein, partial [Clostridiaceae bacterium]|nr:DivIVA domain-containing protein [Clostridiaceae bacterium]